MRVLAVLLTVLLSLASAQDQRPDFVVAVAANPAGLDPAAHLGNTGPRVHYSVYDTLIRRDFLSDGQGGGAELVPMLATSWERLSYTVLELRLRQDVVFHDGQPFTSADVLFTFDRITNLSGQYDGAPYVEANGYFTTIAALEAPDAHTVRIVTHVPDPLLEQRLASWAAWIVPAHNYEWGGLAALDSRPIGTGPYRVVEVRADDRIALEAFDDYWGDPVPVKTLTFRVMPELSARITALVTGEADLITNIPPDQIALIDSYDHVETRSVVLANTHVLRYNARHPVLADKRVRQALNLAIDRQLLVDALWGGAAVVPNGHQYPEYGATYDPQRPGPVYDPELARELLAAAGYGGEPVIFQTRANYYTNGLQAAEAIVEMWRAVGVQAEVLTTEQAAPPSDDLGSMVVNWSNSAIYPDFDGSLYRSWGPSTAPQASGFWANPPAEFNELGEAGRATLDQAERARIYSRMLDIWEEEAPGTILYQPLETYGVRSDLDWQPYSFYFMDLRAYNLAFR